MALSGEVRGHGLGTTFDSDRTSTSVQGHKRLTCLSWPVVANSYIVLAHERRYKARLQTADARRLASELFSRRTWEMENLTERANLRQIKFRE